LFNFLDAIITTQTSPAEAFQALDEMCNQHTEELRKLTRQVQDARQAQDDDAVKKTVNDYDDCLEK
jgi:tetratricopeptide repeat protein 30